VCIASVCYSRPTGELGDGFGCDVAHGDNVLERGAVLGHVGEVLEQLAVAHHYRGARLPDAAG